MVTLRTVTGTLGVITVAVLYLAVRRVTAMVAGAAGGSAVGDLSSRRVVQPLRFQLQPARAADVDGDTGDWWNTADDRLKRWLAVSAFSIGLGAISDVWMLVMLAPFALIVLIRNWRDTLWSVPLALLPFGLFARSCC